MINVMRRERFIPHTQFAGFLAAAELEGEEGALALLDGESEGYAIDATSYDSVTAASYVGGPVGGTVATIDTGTPANDLSNVALDSSNLVQSGTSPKMVHFPSSPYVRWTPHNLLRRSEEFDDSGVWTNASGFTITANDTVAPDGTTTADKMVPNTGDSLARQTYTAVTGFTYTVSVWVKAVSGTPSFNVYELNGPVLLGTINATTSWQRFEFAYAAPTTSGVLQIGGGSTWSTGDNVWLWGAQINRGPIATPYLVTTTTARIGIPQSYDAAAAQYGILVEPAGTNVILRSEEIENAAWGDDNCTRTANQTAAPSGGTTADKIVADNVNTNHSVYNATGLTASAAIYTASVYLKAGEYSYGFVTIVGDANITNARYQIVVDLSNGSITETNDRGGAANTSNSVTSIGNGWYRIAVSMTQTTDANGCYIVFGPSSTGTPTTNASSLDPEYQGDGTSGIYAWGAQMELGTVATSYIPTLGSTVTRATDNISIAVSNIPSYSSAISGYLQFKLLVADGAPIIYADDGTNNNWISFTKFSQVEIYVREGGTDDADVNVGVDPGTVIAKGAFRVATNSVNCAVNGTVGSADTGAVVPVVTNFYFGGDDTGGGGTTEDPIWIYYAAILPRSLSDTELDTLTT
jgi:hypothetical protein